MYVEHVARCQGPNCAYADATQDRVLSVLASGDLVKRQAIATILTRTGNSTCHNPWRPLRKPPRCQGIVTLKELIYVSNAVRPVSCILVMTSFA